MAEVIEIIRFSAPADGEQSLVEMRREADAVVRARFPGLVDTALARLSETDWIYLARWDSREHAEGAAGEAMQVPEIAACWEQVDFTSFELADVTLSSSPE